MNKKASPASFELFFAPGNVINTALFYRRDGRVGLWRNIGNVVCRKAPGVRIPLSPPILKRKARRFCLLAFLFRGQPASPSCDHSSTFADTATVDRVVAGEWLKGKPFGSRMPRRFYCRGVVKRWDAVLPVIDSTRFAMSFVGSLQTKFSQM
jgi:hypothetical protein